LDDSWHARVLYVAVCAGYFYATDSAAEPSEKGWAMMSNYVWTAAGSVVGSVVTSTLGGNP